jgi:phosphoribosylaminoimidazolecarboxamide formyltransferase/IMP cyclohydrolase
MELPMAALQAAAVPVADVAIRTALLSVSDKTGLLEFAQGLARQGVKLLSTGGTAKMLRDAGLDVTDVSDHTGFPEMLDGRVKTLHPTVHGGLLGVRGNAEHEAAMSAHNISTIDLVVVNLYPFEATVARGADYDTCVENIDIGGPAMIRSAAKNHASVTVITDPADYARVLEDMDANSGATTYATRQQLAAKAYRRTSGYDAAISQWFAAQQGEEYPDTLTVSFTRQQTLRYGENPHQSAAFYALPGEKTGLAAAVQLQGKELSYNNINDTDAAWALVQEFEAPAIAIIKHANPCGVALGTDAADAYKRALACDPQSAFGGIIALNTTLDEAFVDALGSLFAEVIIAPSITDRAKEKLAAKKNLRVLQCAPDAATAQRMLKSVQGGLLVQDMDTPRLSLDELKVATEQAPEAAQLDDLAFAFTVAKHVKSNAIVLAKDGATVGIGAGQMSRVDSVRLACQKAEAAGLDPRGSVLASDAFFPFDDNVQHAAEAGVSAIIQPGGSMRDEEVIATANRLKLPMVFTGRRHFRH